MSEKVRRPVRRRNDKSPAGRDSGGVVEVDLETREAVRSYLGRKPDATTREIELKLKRIDLGPVPREWIHEFRRDVLFPGVPKTGQAPPRMAGSNQGRGTRLAAAATRARKVAAQAAANSRSAAEPSATGQQRPQRLRQRDIDRQNLLGAVQDVIRRFPHETDEQCAARVCRTTGFAKNEVKPGLVAKVRAILRKDLEDLAISRQRTSGRRMEPEPKRTRRPVPGPERTDPVEELRLTIQAKLVDCAVDTVLLETETGPTRLRARLDHVDDEVWLAIFAGSDSVVRSGERWTALRRLGDGGRLPLVAVCPYDTLPLIVVVRFREMDRAAHEVAVWLHDLLGADAVRRLRPDTIECSPREAEIRRSGEETVRRLRRARVRSGGAPARASCDRCGQPLSDALSVARGFGPECAKYYSREVRRAASRRGQSMPRFGSIKQAEWVRRVNSAWSELLVPRT